MINSWKELVYNIQEMRQLQKDPLTEDSFVRVLRLNQLEGEVDGWVQDKIAEWNFLGQPELFSTDTTGAIAQKHNPD
jgi:hypothetical protein